MPWGRSELRIIRNEAIMLPPVQTARRSSHCVLVIRFIAIVFIPAFFATPAYADATRDALTEIAKCADIPDSSARLKCFDAAVPGARSALASPAQPEKEKRGILEWFGFSRPQKPATKPEEFGKPPPSRPDEITQITASVLEFAKTARGRAVFILDNGQVWRQLDGDDTVVLEPQPGTTMKVTIAIGLLGNYNLTVEGRNALVRVFRLK